MKKIVLLSLMTLSSGLLGTEYPNRQQPANRIPGPTRQQANQAFHQEQDRSVQGPRSPRISDMQTPVHITQEQGRELNQVYQRAMNSADETNN